MPCYDGRDSDSNQQIELQQLRLRLDGVTRVACELAQVLRSGGTFAEVSEVSAQWVMKHEAWDALRKAQPRFRCAVCARAEYRAVLALRKAQGGTHA